MNIDYSVFKNDENTSEWVEITYTAEDVTEGLVYELNGNDVLDYNPGYTVYLPADKSLRQKDGALFNFAVFFGVFALSFGVLQFICGTLFCIQKGCFLMKKLIY